jgi:competence protein ComEC
MAALVTVALLAGRRAISPRLLGFAAVAVMAMQPAAILGPSFQMSFAAVLALIAGFEAARPWLSGGAGPRPWWQRGLLVVAASLLTSLLAGAATTPFGLHHFGRLQLYGVAANAVAVPLTSLLVMPAGLLALFAMPLGLEAWPLRLMGWGVEGVLVVAREVAGWPASSVAAVPIPGWGLALVALGLCWLCLWRTRWRWLGAPAMAAGLATGLLVTPPDAVMAADGRLFALRSGEQLFLEQRPGASRFTRDIWLRSFGEAAAPPLPREGEVGRIACTPPPAPCVTGRVRRPSCCCAPRWARTAAARARRSRPRRRFAAWRPSSSRPSRCGAAARPARCWTASPSGATAPMPSG